MSSGGTSLFLYSSSWFDFILKFHGGTQVAVPRLSGWHIKMVPTLPSVPHGIL